MKKVLVLVDFTDTADIALDQAIEIALNAKASLMVCHISPEDSPEEINHLNDEMRMYSQRAEMRGVECNVQVVKGSLFNEAPSLIERENPWLVLAGTHGKHGLRQILFGSNIFRLVKMVQAPILVVNDHIKVKPGLFTNILMPVSHHDAYLKMLQQAVQLMNNNGKIRIFAIIKFGLSLDPKVRQNADAAKKWLDDHKINYEYLEVNSDNFSTGYSRETLRYAKQMESDLLAIMSEVSDTNKGFGAMDKENILLNEDGIAVLSCV